MTDLRVLLFIVSIGLAPVAVSAQGMQVAFGGLKQDPSLPVEMTADQLAIDQNDGSALFTGNVVIGQGQMRMTAPWVRVEYATAKGGATGQISRLHATGGVTLVNGSEAAEAKEAVYTIDTGSIVMTGDVLLTQGQNALSSQKMVVDLKKGTAVMDGRVKTILQTGGAKK